MIFPPRLVHAVIVGRKTQARRPMRGSATCRFKVGRDYAVQAGAGRPVACYITVRSVERQRLDDIGYRDARAEGHRTTDEFRLQWVRTYDARWIKRELIDLVAAYDDTCSIVDWILLRRYEQRHADTPVFVITFDVQHDASRFMATQHDILGGAEQYTPIRARAIDGAEAVPKSWLDREAARARHAGEQQRAAFRRALEEERARRNTDGLTNRALRHINNADDRKDQQNLT